MDKPGGVEGPGARRPDPLTLPIATSLSMAVSMNRSQDMPQMTVLTADGSACDAVDSGVRAEQRSLNQRASSCCSPIALAFVVVPNGVLRDWDRSVISVP